MTDFDRLKEELNAIHSDIKIIKSDISWVSTIGKYLMPLILGFGVWSSSQIMELSKSYAKVDTKLRRHELNRLKSRIRHNIRHPSPSRNGASKIPLPRDQNTHH